jgi:hypothetical protein
MRPKIAVIVVLGLLFITLVIVASVFIFSNSKVEIPGGNAPIFNSSQKSATSSQNNAAKPPIKAIVDEKVKQAKERLQTGTYTQDDADYILRPKSKEAEELKNLTDTKQGISNPAKK